MQMKQSSGIGHLLSYFRPTLYFTGKPDSWFRLTKYVRNTFGSASDPNL